MSVIKISQKAKNAIMIGTMCSVSYLAVYIARHVLGAVTPQMIDEGFNEAYLGRVFSAYSIFYAVGQLINGWIGDRIKARYMISFGLLFAGLTNMIFLQVADVEGVSLVVYGMTGFFLSMIYGPMTKVVAENTEPIYATRCSLGYTFASFVGSPMAGFLATFFAWQNVFGVSIAALCVMAIISFSIFLLFEKKGVITYGRYKSPKESGNGSIRELITRYNIIKFAMIAILTGIVRTSVIFWLPTYIAQRLAFPTQQATAIYSAATLVISFTTFVAVFVYEQLKRNMNLTILLMFISSSIFFCAVYFITQPFVNVVLIVLAIMSATGAASMLYSRYCPGLRDTGKVSTVTGFLDFLSYMAAAFANLVFANAVSDIGWGNLILIWVGLMLLGVLISLPYGALYTRLKKQKTDAE